MVAQYFQLRVLRLERLEEALHGGTVDWPVG